MPIISEYETGWLDGARAERDRLLVQFRLWRMRRGYKRIGGAMDRLSESAKSATAAMTAFGNLKSEAK